MNIIELLACGLIILLPPATMIVGALAFFAWDAPREVRAYLLVQGGGGALIALGAVSTEGILSDQVVAFYAVAGAASVGIISWRLAPIVAFGIVRWVFRGFKPRASRSS